MNGLSFANPAFLGALALGALPILIHLVRKRRIRVVPWAAYEFLLRSRKRNRKRIRLEQLLLLTLRILILCLMALAFARPLIRNLNSPMMPRDARVHAIIVLDNSMSMGSRRQGVSDFDRARKAAEAILGRVLRQGDAASIVLASARPAALLRDPCFDLQTARQRLGAARLSDLGTDFAATADFCASLPSREGLRLETYWITDSQQAGFAGLPPERAERVWRRLTDRGPLFWVSTAEGERENLSVDAPRFSREMVTPGAPVGIEALVRNRTRQARTGLSVALRIDGKPVASTLVDVPAQGSAPARFVFPFDRSGVHTGSVELGEYDGLERDNSAWLAVRVRDALRVLVVNPTPSSDPARDEAFYLLTALAPAGASEGARAPVQPTLHTGATLAGRDLRTFDAVALTGVQNVAPADASALRDFVRNGGGLLVVPGATGDAARLNAGLGGAGLLPATYGRRYAAALDEAPAMNPASVTHPALRAFRGTDEVDLGSARYTVSYDLTPRPNDPDVAVACRLTDGRAAVAEGRVGQGRVIQMAAPLSAAGGNLPYKPAYVPFVHQLAAYLAADASAQRIVQVGKPLAARFDVSRAGSRALLTDPSGVARDLPTTTGADGVLFSHPAAERAGIYKLKVGAGSSAGAEAFAANTAPSESDLRSLDRAGVQSALGAVPLRFASASDDMPTVARTARRGVEAWRVPVLLALFLLFLEALLARRFGRRG